MKKEEFGFSDERSALVSKELLYDDFRVDSCQVVSLKVDGLSGGRIKRAMTHYNNYARVTFPMLVSFGKCLHCIKNVLDYDGIELITQSNIFKQTDYQKNTVRPN